VSAAADGPPPSVPSLPALVLRCRTIWLVAYASASLVLLALGTAGLEGRAFDPIPSWAPSWSPLLLLLLGGGCAYFVARYALARIVLDDRGFRLDGPLGCLQVAWSDVLRWERRTHRGGPATLRVVYGPARRRLSIPLVYEDAHFLEVGLAQRGFPKF